MARKDLEGMRFGRLTALAYSHYSNNSSHWYCLCDCGVEKFITAQALLGGKTISCGCYHKEIARLNGIEHKNNLSSAKNQKGELNISWKGGVSEENHCIRTSKSMADWRKQIFDKYDYTCQKCLQRGGKLRAHHIASFHSNPDLRTDPNNGICLCDICHIEFHRLYGRKDNNSEQLNDFLGVPYNTAEF